MSQVLQGFAQNEDRLRRQHRHTLRLPFKFLLRTGITGSVVEQLENGSLLLQASGFRERVDFRQMPRGEVATKDVLQIVYDRLEAIDEKLPFGFEVSKLKNEVNRHRKCHHVIDQLQLRCTQIEVKAAIGFGKAGQAIKFVDFLSGQDRQPGVTGHARRLSGKARISEERR